MTAGLPVASLHVERQFVERRRQEREADDDDADERGCRGDEEAAVDRDETIAVGGPKLGGEDADDAGDEADGTNEQRQQQALRAVGDLSEDERGDKGDGVGLEEVCGHTSAVADVVTDVVGNRGGVAGVVLGDTRLNLADEVGTDVGRLREDAAANTHEHREQGATEAEALEDGRCVVVVTEQHDTGSEEAEADREHADDAAGSERNMEAALSAAVPRGGGDTDIRLRCQRHADVADEGAEQGADDEEHRAAELHGEPAVVHRQHEQDKEDDDREDGQGAELPVEVCASTLHGPRNLLHLRGALVGGEHLLRQPCPRRRARRGRERR